MDNIINNIIRLKISVFAILSVIGLYFLWDPKYLLITLIAYFFYAVIGHDIALHRYFTHRSFTCSKPTEMFLFLCGMLANMGSTIHFVLGHRRHHKYTETPYDNLQSANHPFLTWLGYGIIKATYIPEPMTAPELTNSKFYVFMNKYHYVLYYSFVAVCLLLSVKLSFYAIILPVCLSLQLGSCIDVVVHKVGYRNFNTNDNTTNNSYINALALFSGIGLHNNHHARPWLYTHKVKSNEIDVSAWLIKHVFATSVVDK